MKTGKRLDANWEFCGFSSQGFQPQQALEAADGTEWLAGNVPGDVQTDLMRHGKLNDPTIGTNDVKARWVEERVWVYRTCFEAAADMLCADVLELCFGGLDTYADVYVNGRLVGQYENMFVEHTADIHGCVKNGKNMLHVIFYPVCIRAARPLPEGFWINYSTERAYARKAGYSFGWDWTPRVGTMGLWRAVEMRAACGGCIDGLQAFTLSLSGDHTRAVLQFRAQTRRFAGGTRLRFSLLDAGTAVLCAETAEDICEAELYEPKLWWTHDMGTPFLYILRAELLDAGGNVLDRQERRFGVRTIELRKRNEEGRACFLLVLNGSPIFARGANWVPMSNRLADVSEQKYRKVLRRARDAEMNMLCIWGGGIYEQDVFYDFCDEEGLLIWQYFMFACGEYPDFDAGFVENVKDEITKAVERLAAHPSIALWVGNVESSMLCEKIGLTREMYGKNLFEVMIPQWLAELDPIRPYLSSSPWGEHSANSMEDGDRHNWDVWFQDLPYTEYCADTTCFASEFGLHAAPVRQTVEKYCGVKDPSIDSFAFQYLNRDQDVSRMMFYLREYTGIPCDLDAYINDSMLVQALALQCACGHYRKRFPACGGALIWQLNDCCGAQSWSLVDHDNIPKASWYFARAFFRPTALYLEEDGMQTTKVWVMNQGRQPVHTSVILEAGDHLGSKCLYETLDVRLKPEETRCIRTVQMGGRFYPNVILANRPRLYYLAARFEGQQRPVTRFFERPKDLLLPPVHLREEWEADRVTLTADVFAFFVHLEGDLFGFEPEDNYFDMLPGTSRCIRFCIEDGAPLERRGLRWTARNSAGRKK